MKQAETVIVVFLLVVAFVAGRNMFQSTPPLAVPIQMGVEPAVPDVPVHNEKFSPPDSYQVPRNAPVGNNQVSMHFGDNLCGFYDDRNIQSTRSPQGDTWYPEGCKKPFPRGQQYPSGCDLGCGSCSPNCSGEGNRCGIVAPVPLALWQPQRASTVAYRLKTGNYVPSYCPQGRIVLQKSPGCEGALDYNGDRRPYQTTCYTAQRR